MRPKEYVSTKPKNPILIESFLICIYNYEFGDQPMGMWFVQTWMVLPGKYKEHDELQKRWNAYVAPKYGKTKTFRYFAKWFGPIGGRVFIIEFDSLADYEQWFETFYKDEKNVKFQEEWLTYIDPSSWQGVIWEEREVE